MIWENIAYFIKILLLYTGLTFVLPWYVLYPMKKNQKLPYRALIYFVVSNLYLFTVGYLLGFLHVFSRVLVILLVMVLPIGIGTYQRRKQYQVLLEHATNDAFMLATGECGYRLYFRKVRLFCLDKLIGIFYGTTTDEGKKRFRWQGFFLFLLIAGTVFFFLSHKFHSYGLNTSDEEVHLYWVQSVIANNMFPDGMYPHGLHHVLAIMISTFDLTAARTIILFAGVTIVVLFLVLYLTLTQLFASKMAVFFGMMIYVISNLVISEERLAFTLPMEYGLAAIFLLLFGLVSYVKHHRKSDLLLVAGSIAITLSCHFYVTIYAAFLCLIFGIVYLVPMIRRKALLPILLAGVLGIGLAIVPFGVGKLLGYPFEQSMDWAMRVISESVEDEQNSISEEENSLEATNQDNELVSNTQNNTNEDISLQQDTIKKSWKERFEDGIHWVFTKAMRFWVVLSVVILIAIIGIIFLFYKEKRERGYLYLTISIWWCISFLLSITYFLGVPNVIEVKRAVTFFSYTSIVIYAMPFELIYLLLTDRRKWDEAANLVLGASGALLILYFVQTGQVREQPIYWEFQTDGAMKTCLNLIEEKEDKSWTVVSTVNERSTILNDGYHYELLDFVEALDAYTEDSVIQIPTRYVYFIIEKHPLIYQSHKVGDELKKNNPRVNVAGIDRELKETKYQQNRSELYLNERLSIMSKAYYWARTYKEYFPQEMRVYYEDEDVVVYEIKQDEYALNNFSIDYKREIVK